MELTGEILKKFAIFQEFSTTELESLATTLEVSKAKVGETIIELGSENPLSYLLLEGEVILRAADGKVSLLKHTSVSAHTPLSQLLPRRYDVIAKTKLLYLCLDFSEISKFQAKGNTLEAEGSYVISGDDTGPSTDTEHHMIDDFIRDLEANVLVLPSFPDIAFKIRDALAAGNMNAEAIAEIVQADPVITAKLIKIANSALYAGKVPIDNCANAIVRLGLKTTHNLVTSFALNEVFRAQTPLLKKRMQELWQHSTYVGAICYILAKKDTRFDPEQAMLMGLMHDIGVVAILDYAKGYPDEASDPAALEHMVKTLRTQTGSMILQNWGFPTEYLVCALEAEEWFRDNGGAADYCDLVVIAQLHSFIGKPQATEVPSIAEVPAHSKLELGELTPEMTLQILIDSKQQLQQVCSVLAG